MRNYFLRALASHIAHACGYLLNLIQEYPWVEDIAHFCSLKLNETLKAEKFDKFKNIACLTEVGGARRWLIGR